MTGYIEREAFLDAIERGKKYQQDADDIVEMLQNFPAADVQPVIFCRDCEYWQSDCGWCGYFDIGMNINDFCSRGKKEES